MTTQMILALSITILMIVMIMSDKFSFGAPPMVACCLLVLTGVSTIERAFAGFINSSVIMIAGFMAVMAALQKTSLMSRIKSLMANLASKGGFKAYALLILVAMLGASLMSGSTGYYVMIITIASTIPYSKNLPNSKVLLPMAFASGKALIPVSVAFFMGMAVSLLESAGMTVTVAMPKFSLMVFISSVGFLLWTLFAYRLLPDYDIQADGQDKKESAVAQVQEGTQLPQ